jgi:AraC family transcriptional activator of mtrCDE
MKLLPAADLDRLLVELEVDIVTLSECGVSPEWTLAFPKKATSAIHYNLSGTGQLFVGNSSPINLTPHTVVIIPAMMSCQISASPSQCSGNIRYTEQFADGMGKISRQFAGSGEPAVKVICGYIQATYGNSIDIFKSLATPIVERFDETNGLDKNLKMAITELVVQEVGMRAMTAALLKRVLVAILRRSIRSQELWTERFPILSDPQIARALVAMLSDPTAAHTVNSLSSTAGLSRSAFMARFTRAIGLSPLAALKRLRMREAAGLLAASALHVDQIANLVGYASRSSFSRAFRSVYGTDPSDYRIENSAHAIRKGSTKKELEIDPTLLDSKAAVTDGP